MFELLLGTLPGIFLVYFIMASIGLYNKVGIAKCKSKKRLDGKTVIVTGGTAGMGLEIAKDLARRGAKVIIACPFEEEGASERKLIIEATGNEDVIFKLLDLSSLASVRKFAKDILETEERLDILINNAGVLYPNLATKDGMNFIMQVNYFGHFLLTLLLLHLLKKTGKPEEPSRIINTSSAMHIFGKPDFVKWNSIDSFLFPTVYSNSKLCVTMFTRELANKLNRKNVTVNSTDPGIAVTDIAKGLGKYTILFNILLGKFYPTALEGAQTALYMALDEEASKVNGEYFKNCGLSKAGITAYDDATSRRLWEESVKLVKLEDNELHL